MNKELIYKISKIIPSPIRKFLKKIYNPIIPETEKIDYGKSLDNDLFIYEQYKKVLRNNILGDIIEFGVYRGGSLIQFGKILKETKLNKTIYGLDAFDKLPSSNIKDNIPDFYKGTIMKSELKKVSEVLKREKINDRVKLVKGLFKDSIPRLAKDLRFCFAYVDCDLYEGTKQALQYLIQRMNGGGIIYIDDYSSKNWVGVKKAVLELLPENEIKEHGAQAYWVKK